LCPPAHLLVSARIFPSAGRTAKNARKMQARKDDVMNVVETMALSIK
jgi:hypothetical protein